MKAMADAILSGAFDGEFDVALERSAAFCRVVALGQATLACAEVTWPNSPDLANVLFGVGPMLTGVGLVVAGIRVLRGRRWTAWRRFTPIAVGAYVFTILTPVLILVLVFRPRGLLGDRSAVQGGGGE